MGDNLPSIAEELSLTTTNNHSIEDVAVDAVIYPNPFSDNFNLTINAVANSRATIQVINEIGATIYSQKLAITDNGAIAINLANQADGIYFVRVLVADELPILKKVIKTNR